MPGSDRLRRPADLPPQLGALLVLVLDIFGLGAHGRLQSRVQIVAYLLGLSRRYLHDARCGAPRPRARFDREAHLLRSLRKAHASNVRLQFRDSLSSRCQLNGLGSVRLARLHSRAWVLQVRAWVRLRAATKRGHLRRCLGYSTLSRRQLRSLPGTMMGFGFTEVWQTRGSPCCVRA